MNEPNDNMSVFTVLRRVVRRDPTLTLEDFAAAVALNSLLLVVTVLGLATLLGVDTHAFDVWLIKYIKSFF